jgi:hypothetical protein
MHFSACIIIYNSSATAQTSASFSTLLRNLTVQTVARVRTRQSPGARSGRTQTLSRSTQRQASYFRSLSLRRLRAITSSWTKNRKGNKHAICQILFRVYSRPQHCRDVGGVWREQRFGLICVVLVISLFLMVSAFMFFLASTMFMAHGFNKVAAAPAHDLIR